MAAPVEVPAFLGAIDGIQSLVTTAGTFYELTSYTTSGANNLFESGGSVLQSGRFTAPIDGTYLAAANIRILPTSTSPIVYVRIAVNGQVTNGSLSLQGARKYSTRGTFTISLSGSFRLNQNDYLSVFLGSSTSSSLTVYTESGFSVSMLGSKLVPGFTTSQPNPVSMKSAGSITGYTDLSNYIGSSGAASGRYVMPQSGWYYVSYNMILNGDAGSSSQTNIAINGKFDTTNGMTFTRTALANGYYTLSGEPPT